MKKGRFYRYIYPHHNGYQIIKDNISYGWYDDLRLALYDRDRLEDCNWDIEEWVWLPDRHNPYEDIELPPRCLDRHRQYIYYRNGSFRIQKRLNGVLKSFGSYKTYDEARRMRDKLVMEDWEL